MKNITIEAFVTLIWRQLKEPEGVLSLSDYGHRKGWLEDQDAINWTGSIERRTAARIIHEILRKELKEADEENWHGAERLKDLYDCHSCVNHVAQVYAKGIMEPIERGKLFGMRRKMTYEEAQDIVLRAFFKEKRKIPQETCSQCSKAVKLSLQEALYYLSKEKQAYLIDVRTHKEYEENHLPGARCVPMAEIICNPLSISEDREKPLLFYCEQGYQSEIAANCVTEYGYKKVFYFGSNLTEN